VEVKIKDKLHHNQLKKNHNLFKKALIRILNLQLILKIITQFNKLSKEYVKSVKLNNIIE